MNNKESKHKPGVIYESLTSGYFKIIKKLPSNWYLIRFLDTSFEVLTSAGSLTTLNIKDKMIPTRYGVGFMGDGNYKSTHPAYACWASMLQRCYCDDYHKIKPTYKYCEVCEEWQDYQNFAIWYESNYPEDGKAYELDKDILISGNKIYSPETCLFVGKRENNEECVKRKRKIITAMIDGVKTEFKSYTDFGDLIGAKANCISRVIRGDRKSVKGWVYDKESDEGNDNDTGCFFYRLRGSKNDTECP